MNDISNQPDEEVYIYEDDVYEEKKKPDKVNRVRRFCFVASVTLGCLGGMVWLVHSGAEGKVAEIIADALGTIAIFVVVSYLGASTIDYSIPNLRWGSRNKKFRMSRSSEDAKG